MKIKLRKLSWKRQNIKYKIINREEEYLIVQCICGTLNKKLNPKTYNYICYCNGCDNAFYITAEKKENDL